MSEQPVGRRQRQITALRSPRYRPHAVGDMDRDMDGRRYRVISSEVRPAKEFEHDLWGCFWVEDAVIEELD